MIVATYHRGKLLRRALDSILAQDFRDMEVWVIHDGPPDQGTLDTWAEYEQKFEDAGIDLFMTATEEHTGYYCHARNIATENARGSYVANLDDDNEWMPDALSSLLAAMEEGEMWPDLVYGRREYVLDEDAPKEYNGVALDKLVGPSEFTPWDAMATVRIAGNMPSLNFIDSSDFLVAKGALYRLATATGHIWDENRRRFGDFYLVSDGLLGAGWRFKALDKVVQRYHLGSGNVSLTRGLNETPSEVKAHDLN